MGIFFVGCFGDVVLFIWVLIGLYCDVCRVLRVTLFYAVIMAVFASSAYVFGCCIAIGVVFEGVIKRLYA